MASQPATPPAGPNPGTPPAAFGAKPKPTRSGVVWVAVVTALLLLVLLIVFILQNQAPASVVFLGFEGTLPLGMAMFIASVAGGIVVAVAGAARIIQLRSNARKMRMLHKRT